MSNKGILIKNELIIPIKPHQHTDTMRIRIIWASDTKKEAFREIETLEDLLFLTDELGFDLVISRRSVDFGYDMEVTVYDDYLE
jgi:hypothetical protein